MSENLLLPSSRVALAALLHDLGKFHERTGLPLAGDRDTLIDLYRYSHAAHMAGAWEEVTARAPDLLIGDVAPFASRSAGADITDSLANAAAAHHRPVTFLQWIIATADRAASGFERQTFESYNADAEGETPTRKNRYQARLVTLFDQIAPARPLEHAYPLAALAPETLFPQARAAIEPRDDAAAQAEYAALWRQFLAALDSIPPSHRSQWPLWLDHFDAAWLTFTHAIPSATNRGVVPDVSLYDHSKAVAALAVALWRWHHETGDVGAEATARLADPQRPDWDKKKLLLIQGDFSGIQDFIFAEGGQTQKAAARLLRGRSFQVSLLSELAALAVLEALQLPPTSQIVNAAGKFLIVAPNTAASTTALAAVKQRLDQWFLAQTFGESSLQLAWLPACCNDLTPAKFSRLVGQLFAQLERAKLARFDLAGHDAVTVCKVDFSAGACVFDGRRPAETTVDGLPASCLAADQIAIGKRLADPAYTRLLIARAGADIWASRNVEPLKLDYFGYRIAFARGEEEVGRFGDLAARGELLRCWDMTLPSDPRTPLFNGYARREINAYIPVTGDGKPIDLEQLAQQDGGIRALAALKGDVDHLGAIFQQGIQPYTFARMAALSRQMNAFFAVYLPWLCRSEYPHTYTVFAGGDDFFLIGPWHSTQALARRMREEFHRFVANQPHISFSAGLVLAKPDLPIRQLAREAEARVDEAKDAGRDRLSSHGGPAPWSLVAEMAAFEDWLDARAQLDGFSTGFVYRLLALADMAQSAKPEDAIWQAWLAYRVRRFVVDKLPKEHRDAAQAEIAGALRQHLMRGKLAARIALENHLYRHRERTAQ